MKKKTVKKAAKKSAKKTAKKTAKKAVAKKSVRKAGKKPAKKKLAAKSTRSTPKRVARKTASAQPPIDLASYPAVGAPAPDFALPADDGRTYRLSDLRGSKVILYFYPKDMTPGCTQEACDFRDALPRFKEEGAQVFGVSRDSVESHRKFRAQQGLNFPLLADVEGKMTQAYGVWKEKSMYGRKYMGVERATFIIDESGRIARVYPKVSVPGHVAELADMLGN